MGRPSSWACHASGVWSAVRSSTVPQSLHQGCLRRARAEIFRHWPSYPRSRRLLVGWGLCSGHQEAPATGSPHRRQGRRRLPIGEPTVSDREIEQGVLSVLDEVLVRAGIVQEGVSERFCEEPHG